MNWFKRFIWWKCVLYFALGAALGAAISTVIPDMWKLGAKRLSAQEFVSILVYPSMMEGEKISNIVIYPSHEDVDLLTFNMTGGVTGKNAGSGYLFATHPLITPNRLKEFERGAALRNARKGIYLGATIAMNSLRAKEKADNMPAFRQWDSAGDVLSAAQARNPDLSIHRAWWADRNFQRPLAAALGSFVIGIACSLTLGRRTAEQQAAHELMSTPSIAAPLPKAPAGPSEEDLRRIRELDDALSQNLSGTPSQTAASAATVAASTAATPEAPRILKLSDQPLEAPVAVEKEDKDFAGDFYPTERRKGPGAERKGFSLVELLVVIGIIAVIIAILLPALVGARRSADTIACAANLHSIAQGLTMYTQANQNTFPAAYTYIGQQIVNGVQTPVSPSAGYVHWSSYLFGDGSVPQAAFTCPAMDRGGLPPTNTTPDNMNVGQVCPGPGIVDQQVPRLAYTVNEALCPRNKFVTQFQSAQRIYRYVKASEVADSSETILATEMVDSGNMISYGDSNTGWIMSHRPIQGFCNVVDANTDTPDIFQLTIGSGFRSTNAGDLDPDPQTAVTTNSRLDLVGRNHGPRGSYPDHRLTNFAYVDGHVETKSIYDTVGPSHTFEWGAQFYSLVPNDDFQQ